MLLAGLASSPLTAAPPETPREAWSSEQRSEVLDRTLEIRLDPDLSALSPAESEALEHLIKVGNLLHDAYLESRHEQGLAARERIREWPRTDGRDATARELEALFRTFNGPIATTLDNQREPFLPVAEERPGKNVYPPGLEEDTLEEFLQAHPGLRDQLLAPRAVVRAATADSIAADRARLAKHSALGLLHPGLQESLDELAAAESPPAYYAVPYSLAYAEWLIPAYHELRAAATLLRHEDPDFSAYLANRARDLLSDDYESGDASWVTGSFGNLNAQIGSYETYDDQLTGSKTFFSTSLLVRDAERSRQLAAAIGELQEIENALPYEQHKKVRSDIPVSIYRVIADFGQARGTNTATILPNDPNHARKYGRTILLRHNIMTHPELFAGSAARFEAAVVPTQAGDLTLDGNFQRTLWHEVGHYLGVSFDQHGRPAGEGLGANGNLLEEMKSDLVSLFTAPRLAEAGHLDATQLRSVQASGVLRTLQAVKPRRSQPYQTMQLMQMNYFLAGGLLTFDEESRLRIDYDRYTPVVAALLEEVLAIQYAGDAQAAADFVERWGSWDEAQHGVLAQRLREAQQYRFRRVRYAALGE